MKKTIYSICLGIILTWSLASAQEKHVLNVGDDLITLAQTAAAGDTILVKQGFHKAQWSTVVVDKTLVIMGEAGEEMPKLYIKQIDAPADGMDITIMDLDISGADVDSLSGTENLDVLAADYLLNLIASAGTSTEFGDITVKNCIVRNFNKSIVRGDRAVYSVDNFLFDNLIAYDFRGGSDYGPFRLKSKISFDSFTLSNSTFYNFLNKIIDCQDMLTAPTTFLVKNCTFHNMGGGKSGNYLFDIEDNEQASLTIQSCILGTTNASELVLVNGWRVNAAANLQMMNTAMTPGFLVTEGSYSVTEWDKTEYNLENFDPEWLDPDNGDFTIPEGSDLLEWDPEGKIIGDPRWHPLIESTGRFDRMPDFSFYPNPSNDQITFSIEKFSTRIEIYNAVGSRVRVLENAVTGSRMDISGLPSGLYFVRSANPDSPAAKLIVQ